VGKGLLGVVIGLVTFIVVQQLTAALITVTATGSTIIQNILSLAIAIGVVIGAFNTFLKG